MFASFTEPFVMDAITHDVGEVGFNDQKQHIWDDGDEIVML
jgi:hypothetical protein